MLTDEEIKQLAERIVAIEWTGSDWVSFGRAIEAEVIERCARVCDEMAEARKMFMRTDGNHGKPYVPSDCAAAIRAMKEN